MKRFALAAAALGVLAAGQAQAATGDVTGSVTVTGYVTSKCVVIPNSGSTFSGTIPLGELADSDGTLRADLAGTSAGSPAGAVNFRVNCNAAKPTVTVSADRLDNGTAGAPSGYTDVIDYTAAVDADLAGGSTESTAYTTAASLPAPTVQQLSDRLANASDNVTVKVYDLATPSGALLTAGSYDSTVTVVISPTS
jgi:hypothetical protein